LHAEQNDPTMALARKGSRVLQSGARVRRKICREENVSKQGHVLCTWYFVLCENKNPSTKYKDQSTRLRLHHSGSGDSIKLRLKTGSIQDIGAGPGNG
jgi:hypothetical protein